MRRLCCCAGWLWLQSAGSRARAPSLQHVGVVVVAQGLSCPEACGISPDQGSNPWPLHWQADSQPLDQQRSPDLSVLNFCVCLVFHCTGSLLLLGRLSRCEAQGLLWWWCSGFSLRWLLLWSTGSRARRLQQVRFPGSSSIVVAYGLSCSMGCGIFPRSGVEQVPPALTGGFFTAETLRKPLTGAFWSCRVKMLVNLEFDVESLLCFVLCFCSCF